MPQAVAVPASIASIDRLTLAVDAVRGADITNASGIVETYCFADDAE